jgi:hypothetical protein
MTHQGRLCAAIMSSAALLPSLGQAASFTYTTLAVAGQSSTEVSGTVNAINDHDQVVGGVEDSNFNFQGFVWSGGTFTLYPAAVTLAAIDNAGLAAGYAQGGRGYVTVNSANGKVQTYNNHFGKNPFISHIYGIDKTGAVVAQDQYRRNVTAGYVFIGDKTTLLLVPGSDVSYGGTFATAINEAQTVTGYYFAGGAYEHGFVYQNGAFTSFDVPNALGGTFPFFLGNDGTIAGSYASAPGAAEVGFVVRDGEFKTINPPGATMSAVSAVGPDGELVGSYWNDTGGHGFIYRAGTYHTIDVPGGSYTTIDAVNARGTLVGTYQNASGTVQSYVAQCAGQACTQ